METIIKEFFNYLGKVSEEKKELFDESKKCSIQISLHKIPNITTFKQILCKLPHSINVNEDKVETSICLIVKDIDPKDRDYEKTVRKFEKKLEEEGARDLVTMIMPLKQINLEFRHFEPKRKLSTSFDIFISDKSLHDILYHGSKLGKSFIQRKKMPLELDLDGGNLKEKIQNVLDSTVIRLNGRGAVIDIAAFLSNHTVEQAVENINAIKAELAKSLPGGMANIKSIHVKSTDTLSLPLYVDTTSNGNQVKIKNNITPEVKKKQEKKMLKKNLRDAEIQEKKREKRPRLSGLKRGEKRESY